MTAPGALPLLPSPHAASDGAPQASPQTSALPSPQAALVTPRRNAPLRLGLAGRPAARLQAEGILLAKAAAWRQPLTLHHFADDDAPAALLHRARAAGLDALHVTGALTETMLPLLDQLSPVAQQQHSVDLILFQGGLSFGVNAAAWAHKRAITRFLAPLPHDHALLLGAGRRGRAAACALASAGVRKLAIYDPRRDRALALSLFLTQGSGMRSVTLPSLDSLCDHRFDGIIRAMPAATPTALDRPCNLSPRHWVIDTGQETSALTAQARTLGCRALSGGDLAQLLARRLLDHLTPATTQPASGPLRTQRPFPYRNL
ncbi:hypothetical protein DL237_13950 [Pseudooceanicola sediminis]|uniref:Shikimate dehydrogenase substrate binding N-terminal domain-containing protein n=1 Tax=Pseudooceanicola sediminis TaxID=2211117 RepID=A0A399IYH4_9RHOB|nr:hypothetical protein DL237_13950 [Pseudooceanicola sediminis]